MAVTILPREQRIKAIHDAFIALMWISKRQFAQRLQRFGLTLPQYIALATLASHNQPCTMTDLINVTLQDAPTMTGILDRLVKMGLAERTRSEVDRRVVLVQASQNGAAMVQQIEAQTLSEAQCNYATMADDELAYFEQLLRHILRMHLGPNPSFQDADLDAEINRLRLFRNDPIKYAQQENDQLSMVNEQ
jgi:DNA-binding MarR family transcriptional regulator